MKILEEYFETERILTYADACTITEIERRELRKIAKLERKMLLLEYNQLTGFNTSTNKHVANYYITKRLLTKRMYSTKYDDKSILRREIIYANAILPNDEEIAELLTSNKYTYKHLLEVMRVRKYFLDIIKYKNINISIEELNEQTKIYINYVIGIIDLFNRKFGVNNPTIILNRICELLATRESIFKEITNTK